MLTICPLSHAPTALDACIHWCDAEWRDSSGLSPVDWIAEFQRIEDDPVDEVFIAVQEDTPVGMIWLLEREGVDSHAHLSPWVSNLIVDPNHRDSGVAKALLSHAEAYLAAGGDTCAYLLTREPSVYFTKGWEVADTASLGEEHVFVMQKDLAFDELPEQDQQPNEQRH